MFMSPEGRPSYTGPLTFIVIFTAVSAVSLLVGAVALFSSHSGPAVAPLDARPDSELSAQQLFEDYLRDARLADGSYRGKVLRLAGTLARVGSDAEGEFVVLSVHFPRQPGPVPVGEVWNRMAAAAVSGVEGVRCYTAGQPIPGLRDGAAVNVQGRCLGCPQKPRNVVLKSCRVLP